MRYMIVGKKAAIGLGVLLICLSIVILSGVARTVKTASVPKEKPIYSVETTEKNVSLGINCAWDNYDISTLLSILSEKNVRATFFVSGEWCDAYPQSVRQIKEAGHEVGSHSNTHADMTTLDREILIKEIRESGRKIEEITKIRPNLFRTPSGAYNNTVIITLREEGYYPIQWDCDSIDYQNPTTQQMRDRIMKKLKCGSIMLFHSGAKNTPEALPRIIDAVKAEGYSFVPVGELIHREGYWIDFQGRQFKESVDK